MKESTDSMKDFPTRYVAFMEHFGLNPNKLADELHDSSKVKFHRYKTGESAPHFDTLVAISEKYGVSLDWLMRGIGQMLSAMPDPTPPLTPSPAAAAAPVVIAEPFDIEKQPEYVRLQTENDHLQRMIDKQNRDLQEKKELIEQLLRQSAWLMRQPVRDFDEEPLVKELAGSHATIPAMISTQVDGFKRYQNKVSSSVFTVTRGTMSLSRVGYLSLA